MSFFSALAQALLSLGTTKERRRRIVELISAADHGQVNDIKPVSMYQGMDSKFREEIGPVVEGITKAYRKKYPREFVPDFKKPTHGAYAQDLIDGVANANNRFYEGNINEQSAESRR